MKCSRLPALAAGMLLCTAPAFAADLVVNRFNTAAEIADWRFDFGGAGHVQTFSTDDALANAASGSMQLALTFTAGAGNQVAAYTNDEFFPGQNLAGYTLDFDVKVVGGSALDAFGNNGFFQAAFRNTDNYNFVNQFGDNVSSAAGWRHVQVTPLTAPFNEVRAITLQLYGGPDQNINGTVTLRIDNVVLTQVPEPASMTMAGLASAALLRRRRA